MTLDADDRDVRDALREIARPEGRLVAEAAAPHLLAREGRRRVRRRRVLTASGAVATVAAVGVIVGATTLINQSDSGSMPAPTLTEPAPSELQGLVLGNDQSGRLVLEDLAHPAGRRILTIAGLGAVTTNPAGGWLASYLPDGPKGPAYFGLIDQSGDFTATKQVLSESTDVDGLAVSPDGSRLAYVVGNVGTGPALGIVVEPTPGHSGATRTWTVPDKFVNEITSLSWAPDGRQLSYVFGTQTGAGIGGTVGNLDTATPSNAVPASEWLFGDNACNAAAVAWLGTTGRLTVAHECKEPNAPSGPRLVDVDPVSGAVDGAGTLLQGVGCGSTSLSASQDGSRVLVNECGSVSLVAHGHRFAVPGNLQDAIWAGTGLPTPGTVMGTDGASCPSADFTVSTPASLGLTGTGAAYQTLPVGGSAVVATGPDGQTISLSRGVDQNDFAVSVYSHGAAALVPLNVLRELAYLYPAAVTGAGGPRIPFTTGSNPTTRPCDRWELQTTGVSVSTLMLYAQGMAPVTSPASATSAACPDTALMPKMASDGFGKATHAIVFVVINRSKTSCTISGYPLVTLLDADSNAVPIKTARGSGGSYRDPGPRSITVPPSGRTSFGVTVVFDAAMKCSAQGSMRVTLPGQKPYSYPSPVRPCQAAEMTVTALVAGDSGPPKS